MKNNAKSLNDLLTSVAEAVPEKILYRFLTYSDQDEILEKTVTYHEFRKRVHNIAAHLQAIGASGERALLLYPPSLEYIIAYFGCLHAGVIAVPVYVPMSIAQMSKLKHIADNCQARFVLSIGPIIDLVQKLDDFDCNFGHLQWIATDAIPDDAHEGYRAINVQKDDLAFLQYTSGSTSNPRGVMVSHGNLLHNIGLIVEYFQVDHTIHELSWLPPYHDMGLIGGILAPLYLGACSTLMSPLDFLQKPFRWLQAISKYGCTTSGGPNFAYDLCTKKVSPEQAASLDLRSWVLAFNGAEKIRPATLDAFAQAFEPCGFRKEAFYPCYGMAEATLMISGGNPSHMPVMHRFDSSLLSSGIALAPQDEARQTTLVGCGSNLMSQEIRIVDPQTWESLPECRIGEIWVSGPSIARGYWNQPQEYNSATFQARTIEGHGPYLRTGDLGFLKDSELFVTGRLKDMIISMGRNIYPHDIEFTIADIHPACRPGCGAAFAVEINGNEKVVAVQEIHKAHARKIDLDQLSNHIKARISEEHGIALHELVLIAHGSIPKTSSGKIQRQECKKAYLSSALQAHKTACTPPMLKKLPESNSLKNIQKDLQPTTIHATAIQEWIVARFAQKLEIAPLEIDIHAPLRNFAPSSLDVMEISGELEQWLGRKVPATTFFNYPTIALLVAALAGEQRASTFAGDVNTPQNKDLSSSPNRDVAIVGIGCRFPGGAVTHEKFWELLENGVHAVRKWPVDRVPLVIDESDAEESRLKSGASLGGYIDDVDKFDASFFQMLPREAEAADPQQRLLLETSWHALEDAGIKPSELSGSRTSVFVGIASSDYAHLYGKKLVHTNLYSGIGNSPSIAANRISYFYNFRGPSMVIDTACSSSLVAVHQACVALNSGESDLALAGGVNLILDLDINLLLSRGGMIALDGKCKSFDKSANGYVRGEGCGFVVLKRLNDALQAGDDIVAVIAGSAVNQDGRSNGITAPNGPAQAELIQQTLKRAGIAPNQIGYVEAHGTGTSLGDPIEVNTLIDTLMPGRKPEETCCVGSVKTNIGHLEAAAGIAGLIKTALCLKHERIVPNLHFREINPRIHIGQSPVVFPLRSEVFPKGGKTAYAGVSSFGFGGTNAHAVLRSHRPEKPNTTDPHEPVRGASSAGPVLIALSAHNEERLKTVAAALLAFVQENMQATVPGKEAIRLIDLSYSLLHYREAMLERLAFAVTDTQELITRLNAYCQDVEPLENMFHGNAKRDYARIQLITGGDSGRDYLNAILANRELDKLAHLWSSGFSPDWRFLYHGLRPRRIKLPLYPFDPQSHWAVCGSEKRKQFPEKEMLKVIPIHT